MPLSKARNRMGFTGNCTKYQKKGSLRAENPAIRNSLTKTKLNILTGNTGNYNKKKEDAF